MKKIKLDENFPPTFLRLFKNDLIDASSVLYLSSMIVFPLAMPVQLQFVLVLYYCLRLADV
jgi:hypothetical protein